MGLVAAVLLAVFSPVALADGGAPDSGAEVSCMALGCPGSPDGPDGDFCKFRRCLIVDPVVEQPTEPNDGESGEQPGDESEAQGRPPADGATDGADGGADDGGSTGDGSGDRTDTRDPGEGADGGGDTGGEPPPVDPLICETTEEARLRCLPGEPLPCQALDGSEEICALFASGLGPLERGGLPAVPSARSHRGRKSPTGAKRKGPVRKSARRPAVRSRVKTGAKATGRKRAASRPRGGAKRLGPATGGRQVKKHRRS